MGSRKWRVGSGKWGVGSVSRGAGRVFDSWYSFCEWKYPLIPATILVLAGASVGLHIRSCDNDRLKIPSSVPAASSLVQNGAVSVPLVPAFQNYSPLEEIASREREIITVPLILAGREWKIPVSVSDYLRCKGGSHAPTKSEEYALFAVPVHSQVSMIAKSLTKDCVTPEDRAVKLVDFVHQFIYVEDGGGHYGQYVKFPLETIVEGGGDCEDLAILGASLLRAVDVGAVLFKFKGVTPESSGHVALGVNGSFTGTCWDHDGKKYYFTELTGTEWRSKPSKRVIGDCPVEYRRSATVIAVE